MLHLSDVQFCNAFHLYRVTIKFSSFVNGSMMQTSIYKASWKNCVFNFVLWMKYDLRWQRKWLLLVKDYLNLAVILSFWILGNFVILNKTRVKNFLTFSMFSQIDFSCEVLQLISEFKNNLIIQNQSSRLDGLLF